MNPNLILVKDQDSIVLDCKKKIRHLIISPDGRIFAVSIHGCNYDKAHLL